MRGIIYVCESLRDYQPAVNLSLAYLYVHKMDIAFLFPSGNILVANRFFLERKWVLPQSL